MISANFSRLFICAGFELNKKYIVANLCENRDKPWLHCNGQCYFMKKIKQAAEKDKSDERQSQKNNFQQTFFDRTSGIKFHTHLLQIINTPYVAMAPSLQNVPVFRPPQIC
jgi:hypothetical protein